jgi:cytochrome c nitrite reductase small subunit
MNARPSHRTAAPYVTRGVAAFFAAPGEKLAALGESGAYTGAVRERLVILMGIATGLVLGIGGYTFLYARGASYLTNDPNACANCHIMREQFDAWQRSSHRSVAVCNDCHAPHDVIGKYATKARNGFWHSFYFTTGTFAEPIRITPANARVTEGACRTCHADIVSAIDASPPPDQPLRCVSCHRNVGHPH